MRLLFLSVSLMTAGLPAWAHIGHLAEVAGHGHWLGAAAIGAAIALGAWGARKGKADQDQVAEDESAEEAEEAPA